MALRNMLLAFVGSLALGRTLAQADCNGPNCPSPDDEDNDQDIISFPALSELDIVFPRNETYAVEAPFPVIFGVQNPAALLNFDVWVRWALECEHNTITGGGNIRADAEQQGFPRNSSPHFFYESSNSSLSLSHDEDVCVLQWKVGFNQSCAVDDEGNLRTITEENTSSESASGNVVFTLRPGETSVVDALENYEGCPVGGTGLEIQSNLTNSQTTGCPVLEHGETAQDPDPCELDVEGVLSSLLGEAVTPTTSITGGPSSSSIDSAGSSTATPGGNDGDEEEEEDSDAGESEADESEADEDSGALSDIRLSGGSITLLTGAVAVGMTAFYL